MNNNNNNYNTTTTINNPLYFTVPYLLFSKQMKTHLLISNA